MHDQELHVAIKGGVNFIHTGRQSEKRRGKHPYLNWPAEASKPCPADWVVHRAHLGVADDRLPSIPSLPVKNHPNITLTTPYHTEQRTHVWSNIIGIPF